MEPRNQTRRSGALKLVMLPAESHMKARPATSQAKRIWLSGLRMGRWMRPSCESGHARRTFNGTPVLLAISESTPNPNSASLEPPRGEKASSWKAGTTTDAARWPPTHKHDEMAAIDEGCRTHACFSWLRQALRCCQWSRGKD